MGSMLECGGVRFAKGGLYCRGFLELYVIIVWGVWLLMVSLRGLQ